ncbi:MAG: VanZ family protein [Betaproteobacteria bacterium]|nr:VanZ family protein [Betaproteobacteria bacterium]
MSAYARPPPTPVLARYLAVACVLLVAYASLHPLDGWRDTGVAPLEFLTSPWPRYFTAFDLAINVAGYLPLGFLLAAALSRPLGRGPAALAAVLLGSGLSLGMEVLQNYLPSRVPSNADLACNALGAMAGALAGWRWADTLREGGPLARLRIEVLATGRGVEYGVVVMAVWLVAQLNPAMLLFGNGDLRSLLGLPAALPYTREAIHMVELGVAASGMMTAGLLLRQLIARGAVLWLACFFVVALAARTLAVALQLGPEHYARWVTPGNVAGLEAGAVLLLLALILPRLWQQALAGMALLVVTVLANIAPENPYLPTHPWNQGQYLNFNGLTRLASAVWPFLAMIFLVLSGGRRER